MKTIIATLLVLADKPTVNVSGDNNDIKQTK